MQVELSELELRYAGLRVRDAARTARMRASLAADGQQSAVTVIATTTPSTHRYVLVDGYLRVAALRSLGRDIALAVCVELGDADALIMAHHLDETGRRSALDARIGRSWTPGSAHCGRPDRAIVDSGIGHVDTEIGASWTLRSPSWTASSGSWTPRSAAWRA